MTMRSSVRGFTAALGTAIWTGGLAVLITMIVQVLWTALLLTNLRTSAAVPWCAPAMLVILWFGWSYLDGRWGPVRSRQARRNYLRSTPVLRGVFAWALLAGSLSLVSLAGLWIVLFQLVKIPGNTTLPDFSKFPIVTLAAILVTASLVGAVAEEAGFRGYFQGSLERHLSAPLAIGLTVLLMAPWHAMTQGFVWPTILFYLLVDTMLGLMAFITKSIRPGIVVHAVGLLMFFSLIWPHDAARASVWLHGPDMWFWVHAAQAIAFAPLAALAFRYLARAAARPEPIALG
jgi:membrane protease YdiL (CAAX protease family)